jgi:hypothetical protein
MLQAVVWRRFLVNGPEEALEAGHRVIATARNLERLVASLRLACRGPQQIGVMPSLDRAGR